MILKGKVYKFADNISTDLIISGRYKFFIQDKLELAKHVMEDADPLFYSKITHGESFIVAGDNFGMGSSREQAPIAIKYAGINAVIAKSFARIFYRNAFNVGLPLVETDTDKLHEGDEIELDLENGMIKDYTHDRNLRIKPLPKFMLDLIKEDGIINYFKKHGGIKVVL